MRRGIGVLGFIIIVSIVIVGCTTPQSGTPTGSNSQDPSSGDTNIKTTYDTSETMPPGCSQQSPDPIRFQKFLPNVPGWTRMYGENLSEFNYRKESYTGSKDSWISETYQNPDKRGVQLTVRFLDMGPCITQSTGVYALFKNNNKIESGKITTTFDTFHGYPRSKLFFPREKLYTMDVSLGITNRLMIGISIYGNSDTYPVSEADADIEKFVNAIDLNGLAASV